MVETSRRFVRTWLRPRRLLAVAALCLLLALGLLAAGWFPQERVRLLVERRMREAIGPRSRIGALHVVPGSLSAELRELTLEGPSYRIEVPHARVRATLALVLRGTLDLRSLEADSPRITLRPPPAGAPAERADVRIAWLRVTDATVIYEDERLGGPLRLDDVDASGSIGEGALVASASGGLWSRDPQVPLGPASLRAQVSPAFDLDVQSLEAGTPRSRLRGSGRIQTADPGTLDLRWDASADLQELASFAPGAGKVTGLVNASGTMIGTMDAPSVSGSAGGERLLLRELEVDRVEARFAYELSGSRASWTAQTLGGTVTGDGTLTDSRLSASARAEGIETRRFPASAVPEGLPPSRVSGRVNADGPLDGPLQVTFDLHGSGGQGGVSHQASAQGGGRVDTQGPRVDLDWRAQVALQQPLAPGATGWRNARLRAQGDARGGVPPDVAGTLSGTVALQTATGPQDVAVDGRVTSRGSSVNATLTASGLGGSGRVQLASDGSVVRDLRVDARDIDVSPFAAGATGRVDADLQASGPIDRLSGGGAVRGADLAWQGVAVGSATMDLTGAAGRVRARIAVPSLNVTGEATLDAREVAGRFDLAQTPLAPLQPLLPAGRPLEGAVSAAVELRMPWSQPEQATVDARVASAEVVSGDLAAAATQPFTIGWKDRRARLEGLDAEGEGLHVRASGSAGLRPADPIEGRLEVQGDLANVATPKPWRVAGAFVADAALSGTRAAPRLLGAVDATDVLVSGPGEAPLMALPSVRVELQGDRIALAEVQADLAGGTLTAEGEAPLAALLPAPEGAPASSDLVRARVDLTDVDAGALAAALRNASVPVDGTLSARLTLEGRPAAREIRGLLEAPAATLRVDDVAVELGALRARADGSSIVLDPWTVRSHGGEVVTQGHADLKSRAIEGTSRGQLDLRALSPLVEQGALGGSADLDVALTGTLDAPRASGAITLADGSLRLREIPQAITDIKGRAVLDGRIVRLEDVQAEWGGGTLTATGTAGLAADAPVDLQLQARDVSLRYPRDFRSRLRADLTLGGRRDALLLAGEVHAERGLYDTDIRLEQTLLAPRVPPPAETSSPFLQSIALDLSVVTDRPVIVRNNLAELEASGRLRVRGDARYPAPFGRLDVRDGGKVFLQTREFTIRNGSLTYNGSLDPEIAITAETVISQIDDEDVRVTAVASGPLERPVLDLRSDPSYTEREIASLITTGRRGVLDSPTGAAWAAGEHTAVLLAGRLTRGLSRSLRDLGLDEVDIQPQLLAREADPGARFTFGKLLTPQLKLIYSVGLNDPEARFFQAQYRFRVGREITAKVQYEDGGTYTYGAGQRWRWGGDRTRTRTGGGGRRRGADDTVKLTEVRIEGVPPELEASARRRLRVEPGSNVTFWRLQDESESIQALLHSAGYLEALASADLEGTVGVIEARPGPRYAWMVEGLPAAPDLTAEIQRSFFEEEAIENGRARLLEDAYRRGHVKARVTAEVRGDQAARTIVFQVALGEPAVVREVTFTGAQAFSSRRLLEAAGGQAALLGEPLAARERLVAFYRENHYLAAKVELPRVQESEDRSQVSIDVAVDEGPQALLAEVRFEGITRDETELGDAARIETGNPYDPVPVEDAVQRIRAYYLERGFASVRVQPRLEPRETDLDLVLRIVEGQQQFVGDVVFEGLRRTKESTVRRVVPFKKGDPLDPRALTVLERRLLDLDVFRRAAATASSDEHATITVQVREQGPYALQYDVRHNSEEGFSALLDAEVGNIAGTALALGARVRAGADIRETRGSLHLPALGKSAEITGALFRQEEDFLLLRESGGLLALPTLSDTERQQGFEIQHSRAAPLKWDFLLGYRFKRIESLMREFQQDLSSIQASAIRETRDNTLDAREGMFVSLSLEFGPESIGSDFQFFKTTAQAFIARPLGNSITWAQGYRIGLANGLDEQIRFQTALFGRSTEGFRAGGPNSLRGFATDSVGPPGPIDGLSRGGEAMLILNQELRYRHPLGLGLAVFYDGGNAYPEIKDLWEFKLRHSIGAGLRYDSPVGLLRLDFGFPLNKRASDRSFQWFFSLGQAF
jgi:outer membrane protein insertion porin family